MLQLGTVNSNGTKSTEQPSKKGSKAADLFSAITVKPAFNATLVELSKEGK